MYNVVPVMSVKALLVGTNYDLSGDPLAGRVGHGFVVTVGEDGCSAGMRSSERVCYGAQAPVMQPGSDKA